MIEQCPKCGSIEIEVINGDTEYQCRDSLEIFEEKKEIKNE